MSPIEEHIIDNTGWIVSALVVLLIGLLIIVAISTHKERQRLTEQCMQDGHKEYECVNLLSSNKQKIIPMPIVIPMR